MEEREIVLHVSKIIQKMKPCVFLGRKNDTEELEQYVISFFCPLEIGDTVIGFIDNNNNFIRQPFVQISIDKESIVQFFIIALRGSGFGQVSAEKLYNKLEELAELVGYTKIERKESDEKKEELSIPGIPKNLKQRELEEILIGSDAILTYLSDASLKYAQTKNDDIVKTLSKGTNLSRKQVISLLNFWHQKRSLRRLYLFGLNNKEIKNSGKGLDDLYKICIYNPFIVPSIPFDKCHNILLSMGKSPTDEQILCGKIVRFIYDKLINSGWTCTPVFTVQKVFPQFLSLKDLLEYEYEVKYVKHFVYLNYPYEVETYITTYINNLIRETAIAHNKLISEDRPGLESSSYHCKTLTEEQKLAVQGALNHKISIITGPPGTGKTLISKEIIHNLRSREIPYVIGSFTGCAVSRVHEVLKRKGEAFTLDSMIANSERIPYFKHLLIDECSMVTTELFYRLIKKYTHKFKITIIGDINQLQPIGWGLLMKHLQLCQRIPIYNLTINQRIIQDPDNPSNKILQNSQSIVEPERLLALESGRYVEPVTFDTGDGFYLIEGDMIYIESLVRQLYDAGVDMSEIGILTPYVEYLKELNSFAQKIFLKNKKRKIDKFGTLWTKGERVMMLNNNYTIGVMNGDEGIITGITEEYLIVKFKTSEEEHLFSFNCPDEEEMYNNSIQKDGGKMGVALENEVLEINELTVKDITQSFAKTINKAQGSEIEYCIVYIPNRRNKFGGLPSFLNLNRLYTAITRTRKTVWIIGCLTTVHQMTSRLEAVKYDLLGYNLKDLRNFELETNLTTISVESNSLQEDIDIIEYNYDDI